VYKAIGLEETLASEDEETAVGGGDQPAQHHVPDSQSVTDDDMPMHKGDEACVPSNDEAPPATAVVAPDKDASDDRLALSPLRQDFSRLPVATEEATEEASATSWYHTWGSLPHSATTWADGSSQASSLGELELATQPMCTDEPPGTPAAAVSPGPKTASNNNSNCERDGCVVLAHAFTELKEDNRGMTIWNKQLLKNNQYLLEKYQQLLEKYQHLHEQLDIAHETQHRQLKLLAECTSHNARIDQLEEEADERNGLVDQLKTDNDRLGEEIEDLREANNELRIQVDEQGDKISDLRDQVDAIEEDRCWLEKERDELTAKNDQKDALLEEYETPRMTNYELFQAFKQWLSGRA
jgi:outer membrane murein-binding lipoprotein Lpp